MMKKMEEISLKVKSLMKLIDRYKHFFSLKGFFSKHLSDLMKEIDDITQEFIVRNSDRSLATVEINFGNLYETISDAEQNRIIEILMVMDRERRNFLGNFPIWKGYRQQTVQCLREIAKEVQKVDEHVNRLNCVASISGFSAGLIRVANTVKEFVPVPERVQKVAPILSAVNGIIRSYTSTTREINLERLSKEAKKNIMNDKRQFQVLMHWFEYNLQLMDSVKSVIGSKHYEFIFVKLKSVYDNFWSSNQPKGENWKNLFEAMVDFSIKEGYRISLAVPLAAASLKLIIAFSSVLLSLDWPDAALYVSRIASIGKTMVYGAHAAISVNDVLNTNYVSTSNAGSCFGIILDLGPAVLDFSRLMKSDATNEQAENIKKIANKIEEEICRIEHVYTTLNSSE